MFASILGGGGAARCCANVGPLCELAMINKLLSSPARMNRPISRNIGETLPGADERTL
jgi:hypothetical protein